MKTIAALLDAVQTEHLRLGESGDDVRLRAPVLSLDTDGTPIVYVSAWGGPKRRQQAENALKLFKVLIEKGLEVASDDDQPAVDSMEVEMQARLDAFKAETKSEIARMRDELAKADAYAAALDEILSADVTSAKKAKEIAAGCR